MKTRRAELPVDKSQCKCLADVVLLYIRYACPILNDLADSKTYTMALGNGPAYPEKDTPDKQRLKRFQERAEQLYTECVRGEIVGNPRIKAAGVLYVAAVLESVYVSQDDIADLLCVNSVSIRGSYKQIKEKGQKQGLFT